MMTSISSVGKEYFLVDKTNITIYVRSRLLSTAQELDLIGEIGAIKSAILNESRNKNAGQMVVFNPQLPIETKEGRLKSFSSLEHKSIQKLLDLDQRKKQINFNNNTGGITNKRFYETFPSESKDLANNIKLSQVIDSSLFNGSTIINENPIQSSPLFYEGILYFVTRENTLVAWDVTDSSVLFNLKFVLPPAQRGFAIFKEVSTNKTTLYFNVSNYLVAVDAKKGEMRKDFGSNGYLKVGFGTVAPVIFNDLVITATNSPACIIAVDKQTGEEMWKKNLISGSVWAGIGLDEEKGILFVTTGNPKPPLYGGERSKTDNESNALIALNALDGKILWSFQDVHHDLWDFDMASPPALVTTTINGQSSDLVIAPSKRGNLVVANRETGKLLKDPIYLETPTSDVAGETTSPYQPLIEFPVPFLDHAFQEDHIREDIEFEKDFDLSEYKYGFFEPPSLKKTLITYGLHGGATWTGVSVDPISNQFFVAVNKVPWKLRLFLQDSNLKETLVSKHKGKDYYIKDCSSCHGEKRNGFYNTIKELEHEIIPSLVGVDSTNAIVVLEDIDLFKAKHNKRFNAYSGDKLKDITDFFRESDNLLYKNKKIKLHYLWSMLIDESGVPINKPPYGEVVAYDLESFKVNWKIPVGDYFQYKGNHPTGQFIYGGMASTSDGVLFVTGGPDRYIRAFNNNNGELIWSYRMEAAGSAPPILFKHNLENYLAVISTGGKVAGYDTRSSKLYLFKY